MTAARFYEYNAQRVERANQHRRKATSEIEHIKIKFFNDYHETEYNREKILI